MRTQTISARRMQAAGIPFYEANWYFNVARPRGFKHPGDSERATKILLKVCAVKH